jgi:hypothetical protein
MPNKLKPKSPFTEPQIIEISHTIRRLTYLFAPHFDITESKSVDEYYYWSVVLEILIHLNDLLLKLDKIGRRINRVDFVDFKVQSERKIYDITDMINYFRNAGCHNDSDKRRNKGMFLWSAIVFGAYDYKDEVTIIMGDSALYARQHLVEVYRLVFIEFESINEFKENDVFKEAFASFTYREHYRPDPLLDRKMPLLEQDID